MSISNEIQKLQTNLANSYEACNDKGATMPASQNFDNLADCIGSIPAESVVDKYSTSNIIKRGSLSDDNGLLSNFSNDNYGIIDLIPTNVTSFEFNLDFTSASDATSSYEEAIIGNSSGNRTTPQIEIGDGLFRMLCSADGSSWTASITCNISNNTHYTAKLLWDGTTISGYIKDDNGNITNLTTETSNSLTSLYWVNNAAVGWDGSGTFWKGSINLNNCSLKINGQEVWTGVINQIPTKEYLYPNYTKTGAIIDNAGVVKTFGAAEYLTSTVATPASGTYEINVNFTTPENSITGDSPLIQVNNGDVYVNGNMKLSSWTGSTGRGGITILGTNTNYSFKLVRGNSDTTVYLKTGLPSDSLSDYTQEYTITNYSDNSNIIFLKFGTRQYWPGTIDMKYCNMKQDGIILWEGCTKTVIN